MATVCKMPLIFVIKGQNKVAKMHKSKVNMDKDLYMYEALQEAKKAYRKKEVPIGAVVVYNNKIIGRGYNRRTKHQMATAHAEILAIEQACKKLKSWRLSGASIFVTLEPCPMCLGAILNARIDNLYFGAYEQKGRSLTELIVSTNLLNHTTHVEGGVRLQECSQILSDFFKEVREQKKLLKND